MPLSNKRLVSMFDPPENLDAVEYKNDSKKMARRRMWEMFGRLQTNWARYTPAYRGPVLYLAGSRDLDSHLARRHGISEDNLIAIENNPDVAQTLRAKGRNTITASLDDVLSVWPEHTAPVFVIADLTTNMSFDVLGMLYFWAVRPALAKSCLFVNLQRGRENGTSKQLVETFTKVNEKTLPVGGALSYSMLTCSARNRARIAWAALLRALRVKENTLGFYAAAARYLAYYEFQSYRSNVVTMDSAMFAHIGPNAPWTREIPTNMQAGADTKRKVAAALAIRTRRMKERLCA